MTATKRLVREAFDHAVRAIEWESSSIMIEPEVGGWLKTIAGWLRDNEARVIAEIINQPGRPAQGDGSS